LGESWSLRVAALYLDTQGGIDCEQGVEHSQTVALSPAQPFKLEATNKEACVADVGTTQNSQPGQLKEA